MQRCFWAGDDPLMIDYPDREWGVPLPDDRALFEVLVRHSERGPETVCTAFYYWLPVADPRPGAPTVPNVRRGPLGAYEELFDGPWYCSPQNLWPDDHKWVLQTDWDSWATAVSGPTALIEDIIASPALEAVRLPHLG